MFNPANIRITKTKMVECPVKKKLCLVEDCYKCNHLDQASAYMNRVQCEAVVLDNNGALEKTVKYSLPMIDPSKVE